MLSFVVFATNCVTSKCCYSKLCFVDISLVVILFACCPVYCFVVVVPKFFNYFNSILSFFLHELH